MGMTDPLADMFTRIRNANQVYHDEVEIPLSKLKLEMVKVLASEGYVEGYKVAQRGNHEVIQVRLKYGPNRRRVISGIKRISKPGLRVYVGKDEIPHVLGGLGLAILSTSKGILTDRQARREQLGGEVICYIW